MRKINEIMEYNGKYWFDHQSPMTCVLGSDGVGHDIIHPMDKFQAACRNAVTLYHSAEQMREDMDLKRLEIRELEEKIDNHSPDMSKNVILLRRAKRVYEHLEMQQKERQLGFEVFHAHAMSLLPQVTKYKHIDEALPEMWAARVGYAAMVKNHPLGQELKVALMSEDNKKELLKIMDFPKQLHAPDADAVLSAIDKAKGKLSIEGYDKWQKTIGHSLDQATLEQTRD